MKRLTARKLLLIAAAFLFCFALCGLTFVLKAIAARDGSGEGGLNVTAIGFFSAVNRVEVNNAAHADEPPARRPVPQSKAQAEVAKLLADQEVAWNKGDLKGFMEGYWNSPELSFYSGNTKTKGWQETYDRYKKRYQTDGREMGTLSFTELVYEQLADDTFLVRGRWKLKLSTGSPDGLYSLIVKKKPEGWRVVHDHTSIGEPEKKQP